ncbi:TlpA family protein disulfide reductase [Paenibacillus allorhizosphaerae]|uniref:Thiol-disulfide oxidoreductase ResA n=1 Tax=Paenibacillus allorhizosphaerae TaxID=2849866 RepID=A0ABN7TJH7_9BACL|nr:TlpA disulfide reductase family protein [Paenibacillus allorhizosphaerae]CAG7638488.1 Thiol-disulfide oxidoreductase ResA [Paenibacillus allorhizosphaerae]
MMRNRIIAMIILLFAGATVYLNMFQSKDAAKSADTAPQAGYLAPSFELASLEGQPYRVGGSRDKPLLLNFWASWCGPCRQEAPDLKALYDQYKDRLDLYAVNATHQDTIADVRETVKEFDFRFPILLDPKGDATGSYQVRAIPTSFLIDKSGKVVDVLYVMEREQLEQKIKKLISD